MRPRTVVVIALAAAAILVVIGIAVRASLPPQDDTSMPTALTRQRAVAVARDAALQGHDQLTSVHAGPSVDVLGRLGPFDVDHSLSAIPPDRWVWVVTFSDGGEGNLGGEGSAVVIDYLDGRVYGVVGWIG